MLKSLLLPCLMAALCIACQPGDPAQTPDYFPLVPDNYSIFRIEKTKFTFDKQVISDTLLVNRTVSGPVKNAGKSDLFTFQFATQNTSGNWQIDSANAVWKTIDKVIEQENGNAIIKMPLPLSENLHWNCNTYNAMSERLSRAVALGKPFTMHSKQFPRTVTIIRQDDSTLLTRKRYIEIYAENMGLIRRERINLQYCFDEACRGKGIVETGWKEIMELERTGKQ